MDAHYTKITSQAGDLTFDLPTLTPPRFADCEWTLTCDWHIIFRGEEYSVPRGFATDGASIPRFLWRICGTPLETPRLFAAIVHDFIYAGGDPEATRKDADDLYRAMLVSLGVCRVRAFIEWAALRAFGWIYWRGRENC